MHHLTKEYKKELKKYDDFKLKIEVLIRELLVQNDINYHKIESRIKLISKLDEKIYRKNEKYDCLNDITDLVGLRIITYFDNEVDNIAEIVGKEFIIDPINSIDKRNLENDRFGYKSLHYVVSLNDERKKLTEYNRFKEIKVEIQIRSILQHAWAEIEHDLGYKSEQSIPDSFKRNFHRVAALLEIADIEFVNIKKGLELYENSVGKNIKNHPENVEINSASLKSFVQSSKEIKYIDKAIVKATESNYYENEYSDAERDVKRLDFLNVNSIKELENLLKSEKENIIKFALEWLGKTPRGGGFMEGVAIFYLGYLLVGQKKDLKFANDYYIKIINKNAKGTEGKGIIDVYNKLN